MSSSRLSRTVLRGAALAIASLLAGVSAEAQPTPDAQGTQTSIAQAKIVQAKIVQAKIAQTKIAQTKITKPATVHKLAIQVDQNDKAVMHLALNNAKNVLDYYNAKGERVDIEIVAYGPGLHMLRTDTSPVKERIGPMSLENPSVKFIACGNTQANQSKAEGKPVMLLSEAKVVPSGVVRLMELQKQGYAYIRP
jgi:intracellular sulfur oxidation DsrE/DsrF family protein